MKSANELHREYTSLEGTDYDGMVVEFEMELDKQENTDSGWCEVAYNNKYAMSLFLKELKRNGYNYDIINEVGTRLMLRSAPNSGLIKIMWDVLEDI